MSSSRQSRRKSRKQSMLESNRYKLVIVGDGACGKTSLLTVFKTGVFPTDYIPTIFETDVAHLLSDDHETIELALWDTAGQETYDKLRPLSYPCTDVVLITFSIDRPESLSNVVTLWAAEVRHFCRGVPVILVGNKTDLRNDPDLVQTLARLQQIPVTSEQAELTAKTIKATAYVECSAKLKEGVENVFQTAARAAIARRKGGFATSIKSNCSLL